MIWTPLGVSMKNKLSNFFGSGAAGAAGDGVGAAAGAFDFSVDQDFIK